MGDASEMSLGLESVKAFSGKITQAVFGFVGAVVFARALGADGFGGFYSLLAVVLVADRPVRGVAQAVEKRSTEVDAVRSEVVGAGVLAAAVVVATLSVAAFLLRSRLRDVAGFQNAWVVFVVLLAALSGFTLVQKLLGAEGVIGVQTWNDTLRSLLTLPAQIGLVLAGVGAAGLGYGLAAATVAVIPVGLWFARPGLSVPSVATLRSVWSFARHSAVGTLVGKAYDQFDILLLNVVLGQAVSGYYKAAFSLAMPGVFLANVVASGLAPKLSNQLSKGGEARADVTNGVSYASLFAVPVFFGALALPDALMRTVFGGAFDGTGAFLVGLALYNLLHSQVVIYQHALNGLDRPDLEARVSTVTLVGNVVLGVAAVYVVGGIGVVIATVLAEACRAVAFAHSVRSLVPDIEVFPRPLVKQLVAGVTMAAVLVVVRELVPIGSVLGLAAAVAVGAVVYLGGLLAISAELRLTLRAVYADAVG
ncbi:lipopolysaccharide biosynthesis protein [Halobaculum sp. MBLA0147]|uniref:lipopolysaccharide biosynthesis protein n=1 Tax=Halobaculum sp. MBLA0147 TaxID=3079934 RepID=UPI0035232DC5